MKKHKILPILAALFLPLMQGAACRSEMSSARQENTSTQIKDNPDVVIQDANWELQLVGNVPVERSPLSMSCTPEGFCWLCNSHLIWAPANGGGWRQLPDLELGKNETIWGTFLLSPKVGWIMRSSGLYKTQDGGINWIKVGVPELDNGAGKILRVHFRDENVGWVAGGKYRDLRKGEGIVNNALSDDRKKNLDRVHIADC